MQPAMKRFPETVREAMRAGGAAATCVPVQLDGAHWETAFFFQVAGPECKEDRRVLRNTEISSRRISRPW
jgi:hypothetical protein